MYCFKYKQYLFVNENITTEYEDIYFELPLQKEMMSFESVLERFIEEAMMYEKGFNVVKDFHYYPIQNENNRVCYRAKGIFSKLDNEELKTFVSHNKGDLERIYRMNNERIYQGSPLQIDTLGFYQMKEQFIAQFKFKEMMEEKCLEAVLKVYTVNQQGHVKKLPQEIKIDFTKKNPDEYHNVVLEGENIISYFFELVALKTERIMYDYSQCPVLFIDRHTLLKDKLGDVKFEELQKQYPSLTDNSLYPAVLEEYFVTFEGELISQDQEGFQEKTEKVEKILSSLKEDKVVKEKQNKHLSLMILTVLCAICLVGLGGYYIYQANHEPVKVCKANIDGITKEKVSIKYKDKNKVTYMTTTVIYDFTNYVSSSQTINDYERYIKDNNPLYKGLKGVKASVTKKENIITYKVVIDYSKASMEELQMAGLVNMNGDAKEGDYVSLEQTVKQLEDIGYTCK